MLNVMCIVFMKDAEESMKEKPNPTAVVSGITVRNVIIIIPTTVLMYMESDRKVFVGKYFAC